MRKLSPITAIFLIVLVDILGFTILIPLLPFYAERFGATPQTIGLLVSTYAVCQLVAGPLLGRFSDTIGRKPLLIVSQIGTCLGFLLLAFSNSLALIFVSRIIDGLTAGNLSLAQAFISDVTAPQDRAKAFGKIGIAFGVGFLLGPAIAGALSHAGPQAPIFLAAALSFTSIMATTFLLPRTTPAATSAPKRGFKIIDLDGFRRSVSRPGLGVRFLQFFLFIMAFNGYVSIFPLFASRQLTFLGHAFGATEVSYVYAYTGFLGILVQGPFMGRLVKRFGEQTLTTIGFIGMAVGYGGLILVSDLPTTLIAVTFSAVGSSLTRPSLTSLITQRAGRHEQGTVLGINQSLQSMGQICAPMVGGFLIERGLLPAWCVVGAAAAFFGFALQKKASTEKLGEAPVGN
jgi:MFS family permease